MFAKKNGQKLLVEGHKRLHKAMFRRRKNDVDAIIKLT